MNVQLGLTGYTGSGPTSVRMTYTYDENGNLVSDEWDEDGDGTPNARTTYTYDDTGNVLEQKHDRDADGEIDATDTWEYDADGNLVRESVNGYVTEFTYYEDGTVATELWDPTWSSPRLITYTYDEEGRVLIRDEDYAEDGTSYERTVYHYNAEGHLVAEQVYEHGGSDVDRRTLYIYDEKGNLLCRERYHGIDAGEIDDTQKYAYDERGNVLTDEYTYKFYGAHREFTAVRTITYTYGCWE